MGNPSNDGGRELTTDELDIEDMVGNMHARIGAAWALSGAAAPAHVQGSCETRPTRANILHHQLYELIPFTKALGRLARENPGRARELWAEALREPMPFGGKAIGMPRVANLDADDYAGMRNMTEDERREGAGSLANAPPRPVMNKDGLQWLRPEGGSAEDAVDRAAGKGD